MRVVEVNDVRLLGTGFMAGYSRDDYDDRAELRRENSTKPTDGYRSRHAAALQEEADSYIRDGIRQRMEQLSSQSKNWFSGNLLSRLEDVTDFQNASLMNQRYIMAYPKLRQLRKDMLCNGFFDTLDDEDPHAKTPESHIDYRRAMSGVVQFGEGDEARVQYHSSSDDEESALSALQRHIIQANWGFADVMMENKLDPSSRTGGKLGG